MTRRIVLAALAIGCIGMAAPQVATAAGGAWVGTYEMVLPEEIAKQMKDAGAELPTLDLTLHADGTVTTEGMENGKKNTGKGSYAVVGTKVTITEAERNGKPVPEGTEPLVLEGKDGFAVLAGEAGSMPMKFVRK